jgi:N6-L-threonylcarbamoyladenine synthase
MGWETMIILGIESSCDECAAALVEDGREILSNVVATQIPQHAKYSGVVPEIASRLHTEWIDGVVKSAFAEAGLPVTGAHAVAVTSHPGLLGSLIVGLTFAKSFAWSQALPFLAVNHMLAHLYASQLRQKADNEKHPASFDEPPAYPFLGLLVSGGHSLICVVENFDTVKVLGATIDDAVGEAFDKVSKFYGFGYPGGRYIDELAKTGDAGTFKFPMPSLHKLDKYGVGHKYDLSYSGLKTAVINQIEQCRKKGLRGELRPQDIAASFQKTAIDILVNALLAAARDTGLKTIVAGGGVAANSLLRAKLAAEPDLRCIFPPPELCGDNGAMVAGIAYQYFKRGDRSPWTANASGRVEGFKRKYP